MKNLILTSFLIVSFTVSAQFIENRTFDFGNTLKFSQTAIANMSNGLLESIFEVEEVEEDAPFDFDIKKYLPLGFNPYVVAHLTYTSIAGFFEEADEEFDFDTKSYLPENFNASYNEALHAAYAEVNREADVPFDFDTKAYLPVVFDPFENTKALKKYNEMNNVLFDFDLDENQLSYVR
ncbi:MAG: hypothetical protein WBN16_03165 [Lutimonas sp.]